MKSLSIGTFLICATSFAIGFGIPSSNCSAQFVESQLANLPTKDLISQSLDKGDAARGAAVFHQSLVGCARCHYTSGPYKPGLGPDLAFSETSKPDKLSNEAIVESILKPSASIRKGYETVTIVTTDGAIKTGRILKRDTHTVSLIEPSGQAIEVSLDDVESLKESPLSLMPAGIVNQLSSTQQFFDLIKYLIEIRDGGTQRAAALAPSSSSLAYTLPEYESHLDHRQLVSNQSKQVIKSGEKIYRRVCANCHGTHDQPGSLPTSLRFAEGKFKNGSDPWSMYKTLTHGFGMMTPQIWMVPSQKYAVIHYIREAYLRSDNPTQWTSITDEYLASLPRGDTLGPEPVLIEPWSAMDYGPHLTHTFEIPGNKRNGDKLNIAYKGIAIRLDSGPGGVARGKHWMVFDTDTLRWAAGWSSQNEKSKESFINWRGIQFNGEHQIHPSIVGDVVFANSNGPGVANPKIGSFEDNERVVGRDGRNYGPLPSSWGRYLGLYRTSNNVTIKYRVGDAAILETPSAALAVPDQHGTVFVRNLLVDKHSNSIVFKVAEATPNRDPLAIHVAGELGKHEWIKNDDAVLLKIDADQQSRQFAIAIAKDARPSSSQKEQRFTFDLPLLNALPSVDFQALTRGGPALWTQTLETTTSRAPHEQNALAVDTLTAPEANPWLAQLRLTGLDYLDDGRLAVCTWDGDVWLVKSIVAANNQPEVLQWKRITSGLFQPLGIKVVDGAIYVTCRDQIVRLHDLNSDEEIDFQECFNNDQQVTEHFHEFAMGLQRDTQGNFYYAKSARHALKAIVPQHGTLLKVSPDGSKTEIIANGFRAANGVCLNPDGTFFVTDQEGHWNPKNRINWVRVSNSSEPNFYGNMFGYSNVTDASDSAMEQPLCWITNEFDRSPGELLWVDSKSWGPLNGALLNLSYGTGKAFFVPYEKIGDTLQGGMIQLPIDALPTGIMRGRFSPTDHHLYACGMFAWAGNAQHPGGLYRIRATGRPFQLPTQIHCTSKGIELPFASELDGKSIKPEAFAVKTWELKRTANYGSKHYNEKSLKVSGAELAQDNKTVLLTIPDIQATWCMEIRYELTSKEGQSVHGVINNTIHKLSPPTIEKSEGR